MSDVSVFEVILNPAWLTVHTLAPIPRFPLQADCLSPGGSDGILTPALSALYKWGGRKDASPLTMLDQILVQMTEFLPF